MDKQDSEIVIKRFKMNVQSSVSCKHFVERKKRFCKMTVANGKEYCGEHAVADDDQSFLGGRVMCPLDKKHTVYRRNLEKHLKICNARKKDHPSYIKPGINCGSDDEDDDDYNKLKLSEIETGHLNDLIAKIEKLHEKVDSEGIAEVILEHEFMRCELSKEEYGKETLKHLKQTAGILGYLDKFNLLHNKSCYIEFGAGKGQVSYWLAQLISTQTSSKVLLVDKASHRHKKDNKIEDKDSVLRIRADISDLHLKELDILKDMDAIVGVSKHLCGAATDLALRCLLNEPELPVKGFIIAVCCHHRCVWRSFVGKKFLIENGFTKKDFVLMTKMASWAICGTGFSREKRKQIEEIESSGYTDENISDSVKLSQEKRADIGRKCKRILDYARIQYISNHGFECSMKYYAKNEVTLENVCLLGKNKS